jgi:hypothetical protein
MSASSCCAMAYEYFIKKSIQQRVSFISHCETQNFVIITENKLANHSKQTTSNSSSLARFKSPCSCGNSSRFDSTCGSSLRFHWDQVHSPLILFSKNPLFLISWRALHSLSLSLLSVKELVKLIECVLSIEVAELGLLTFCSVWTHQCLHCSVWF